MNEDIQMQEQFEQHKILNVLHCKKNCISVSNFNLVYIVHIYMQWVVAWEIHLLQHTWIFQFVANVKTSHHLGQIQGPCIDRSYPIKAKKSMSMMYMATKKFEILN